MGPLCPCPNSKKPMKKYQGHLMGPPTDHGPSGSARVSKWSVRPCSYLCIVEGGARSASRVPNTRGLGLLCEKPLYRAGKYNFFFFLFYFTFS
ncbi:unnamed protein product, partial [Staurois parvus]